MTTKNKRTLAFFCNPGEGLPSYQRTAVLQRFRDWVSKSELNDQFQDIVIIDSTETKFCILDTEDNIKREEGEGYEEYISRIHDQLVDCLTVGIDINNKNN